jgi:hypothetical protein
MARKLFVSLNAEVEHGEVEISVFKSTPLCESEGGADMVIKVFRKEEPEFEFCYDKAEYFDGMDYKDAELIFEERLEPINDRKFEIKDRQVKTGRVYSYWISSDRGDIPIGPMVAFGIC